MPSTKPEICQSCGSAKLIRQINRDKTSVHYGLVICGDCTRHIRWLPDPAVDVKHKQRQLAIDEALASDRVCGWQAYFLRSIRERRHLTVKQQEKLQQILAKQKPQPGRGGGVAIA